MLSQMIDISDIPIELLPKYYIRMYTSAGGNYFKYMKFDLLDEDEETKLSLFIFHIIKRYIKVIK